MSNKDERIRVLETEKARLEEHIKSAKEDIKEINRLSSELLSSKDVKTTKKILID